MRTLIHALLVVVVIVVVAFFAFGWWTGSSIQHAVDHRADRPTGTSGTIDTSAARAKGAELGERAAVAASKVAETVDEAKVTAKIKAKMALDDRVKARAIDVTTNGSTVTLSGTVGSAEERDRAIRLARETDGVTRVVDQLRVR